ncbi:hypothetical protein FE257_009371 [Aspergillus nanangensis]|uniref:Uncharacterized protein n=1 Tax=Aspergillus nanangensis TaxID=2582783 RepID=A0AAD4GST1_ASPNN|nr:hypothetical protein FE257_009371 [Aspergillus nanangensis]
MLLNLGLTADAAAAHESDIVGLQKKPPLSPPPRHSSSSPLSFANLPSIGLSHLYRRYKDTELDTRNPPSQRAMSISPAASVASSGDGDYSTAGPILARPPISRSQSVRKQSSRPKTCYHLAHPVAHARHRRLKLRPKLLVQLQRVSPTTRPQPVLDVLPSTVFLPRLARKFPTIFRGKKGLGPNDLIIVTSDLYERSGGDIARQYLSSEQHGEHQEVVATVCQLLSEDALSKGKTEICLNYGPVWEATPLPNGSYEFVANTKEHGIQTLRWVQRGLKSRRVSAPPGSPMVEDTKRFTFSVINPNTRRHPVIATMTRNCLEVFDEYTMPSPSSSNGPQSPAMSMISDGSEMDAPTDRKSIATDDNLRTLIIITSIWVAFREGWSDNFTYNDAALAINPKTLCSPISSRHQSPTAVKSETDHMSPVDEDESDRPPRSPSKRPLSTSTTSRNALHPDRSMGYGSLSRRSNSTGAAFIERSNRRVSARRATSPSFYPQHDLESHGPSRTGAKTPDTRRSRNGATGGQTPDKPLGTDHNGLRQVGASNGKDNNGSGKNAGTGTTKGKRRHRLSNLFDFITKRSGNH